MRLLLICLAFVFVSSVVAQENREPLLQARLETPLASYLSKAGTPFRCVVIAPYQQNGEALIPQGSTLFGVVHKSRAVGLGLVHERAVLQLEFVRYQTRTGRSFPFRGKLVRIENAREEVTHDSIIKGVIAANNPNQLINGLWKTPQASIFYRSFSGMMGVGAEVLEKNPLSPLGPIVRIGLRCALLRFPEPEIYLPPGTDFQIAVDRTGTSFEAQPVSASPEPPAALAQWIDDSPNAIETKNGKPAGDLVNVVFLGSREELVNAFAVSGWILADRRTSRSLAHAFFAFSQMTSYAAAPVSPLLYGGRRPDFTFEKSLDTVSKRHHIRVWYAGVFEGQALWIGAATHDTGLRFNRANFLPTHAIDSRLDAERDKVATDLEFAGCSQPAMYATRKLPVSAQTDGRVSVLSLESCEAQTDRPAFTPPRPGNRTTRFVRRLVLEGRSYIVRENVYYWSYQMLHHYWTVHRSSNE